LKTTPTFCRSPDYGRGISSKKIISGPLRTQIFFELFPVSTHKRPSSCRTGIKLSIYILSGSIPTPFGVGILDFDKSKSGQKNRLLGGLQTKNKSAY